MEALIPILSAVVGAVSVANPVLTATLTILMVIIVILLRERTEMHRRLLEAYERQQEIVGELADRSDDFGDKLLKLAEALGDALKR